MNEKSDNVVEEQGFFEIEKKVGDGKNEHNSVTIFNKFKIHSFNTECLKDLDRIICKFESISFSYYFKGNVKLSNIIFPIGFNTSNVTSMRCMFDGCKSLKNLDLSTFSTNNVADMSEMFSECKSLTIHGVSISNIGYVKSMIEELIDARSVNTISLELTELEYEGHGNHR